jgi:hypothetical protein
LRKGDGGEEGDALIAAESCADVPAYNTTNAVTSAVRGVASSGTSAAESTVKRGAFGLKAEIEATVSPPNPPDSFGFTPLH